MLENGQKIKVKVLYMGAYSSPKVGDILDAEYVYGTGSLGDLIRLENSGLWYIHYEGYKWFEILSNKLDPRLG